MEALGLSLFVKLRNRSIRRPIPSALGLQGTAKKETDHDQYHPGPMDNASETQDIFWAHPGD